MTKQELNALSNVESVFDISKNYSNDLDYFEENSDARVICGAMIDYDKISKDRSGQVRAKDLDKGHKQKIKQQIEASGLSEAVIVIWDSMVPIFRKVTGHHRTEAIHEISIENDEEQSLIPCIVVEFDNEEMMHDFKEIENNKHRAQKIASKEDAIMNLQARKARNYNNWETRVKDSTEHKAIRQEAYDKLTELGYQFQTSAKEEIVTKAFQDDFKVDVIASVTKNEIYEKAQAFFNVSTEQLNGWTNGAFIAASSTNAMTKVLKGATRKRLSLVAETKFVPPNQGQIDAIMYVAKSTADLESLNQHRLNQLETLKIENIYDYSNPWINCVVRKVAFMPQFKSGDGKFVEKTLLIYTWDNILKTFVDDKGIDFRKSIKSLTSKPTIAANRQKFKNHHSAYLAISEKIGFQPRSFEKGNPIYFTEPEIVSIVEKVTPGSEFKMSSGNYFSKSIPNWTKQKTVETHPTRKNMIAIYRALK